jgi:prepilin-type N-terminal cleavage/methylation domain-containing protein
MKGRADDLGFTLIEMLVTIAVIAVGLVPIVEMQGRIARFHAKQIEMAERLTAERTALALLRDMNPTINPKGTATIGVASSMTWQATPISAPIRSLRFLGGQGQFYIVLYRLDVSIDHPKHQFSVERIGWQRM